MAKSRKEGRQARALARNPTYALQQSANRVEKRKAKKQARKTDRALQMTLHHLHTPDLGRRPRKEARRWVQAQLNAKVITGYIAMELFAFVQEPKTGRKNKGRIERGDLSEEAEAVWVRYLGTVAGYEGEERAMTGKEVEADAVVAGEGAAREGSGALSAVDDDEEDDNQVMLSPEPQGSEEEVGVLGAMEGDNPITLCHRPRSMAEEGL